MAQLWDEHQGDCGRINELLDKMGHSMGTRLIDDFLIRSGLTGWSGRCQDAKEMAEVISRVAFRMYLNITPTIKDWSADQREFTIQLDEWPLIEYAELPKGAREGGLWFGQVAAGMIRGAMEMIGVAVEVQCIRCALHGHETNEMRVRVIKKLEAEMPPCDL